MGERCKQWASCLDSLRVIPRILVFSAYLGYGLLTYAAWEWFITFDWNSLENEAVALAIVLFPGAILSALAGVLGGITKAYFAKPGYAHPGD